MTTLRQGLETALGGVTNAYPQGGTGRTASYPRLEYLRTSTVRAKTLAGSTTKCVSTYEIAAKGYTPDAADAVAAAAVAALKAANTARSLGGFAISSCFCDGDRSDWEPAGEGSTAVIFSEVFDLTVAYCEG